MVMATTAIPPRSEVAHDYTWNAESVFPTRADWAAELKKVLEILPQAEGFRGHLGDSPAVLADWLEWNSRLYMQAGKVYMYASMSQAVDNTDQEAISMIGQAGAMVGRAQAITAFDAPETLEIGQEKLMQWVVDEPRLAIYKHNFEDLFRQQEHVRSAEVEELLGMVSEPFGAVDTTYDMLNSADLTFKPAVGSDGAEQTLAQGSINRILNGADRELRRTAWENYADSYLAFKNTFASNLTAAVKRDVFYARARRYPSSLEAALFRFNIPTEVFHTLIETYRKNLPTWHRYWEIRKRALGVDTLQPYDIWAPLTENEPVVSYQQAVDWICDGLKPLGDEYVRVLRQGCLQDRWVDVYPNVGKREGAFSFGWHGTHPFINMSYTDDMQSLSTLAHELGHSMHSYQTWQHQPTVYSNYSMFVAEVASNFNQAMVRAHLIKTNPDRDFQLALINEAMDNIHRYFFIMPNLARFELEMHERLERGAGVTAEDMNALLVDLYSEGYGGQMHIDPERTGITWAEFGHLYGNFYVFQYATGISAAHALSVPILEGKAGAAENYLKFLSAGSSLYPLDALKLAGVDMRTPEAVERTFQTVAGYVDKLDELTR